jgi:RNA polymerase sigma-70 factor (ECF subfamily)
VLHSLKPAELESHTRFLRRYARSLLRIDAHVDDHVQDTLVAAMRPVARYDGRSTLRTWLVGILRHKIADHARAMARRARLYAASPMPMDEDGEPESWAEHSPHAIDDRADPAAIVASRQELAAAERALSKLPARMAAAYVLWQIEGHDSADVCARLGISPATLWMNTHRARKAVRARLDTVMPRANPSRAAREHRRSLD